MRSTTGLSAGLVGLLALAAAASPRRALNPRAEEVKHTESRKTKNRKNANGNSVVNLLE